MNRQNIHVKSIYSSRPLSRGRTAGFTLVELMVALAVGALAITSVYTLGAASSRQFGEQRRVSNVQTSLRIAMNQIKQDLTRAGFMGTPNAALPGETCMQTHEPVAVTFLDNPSADFALIDPNNQHAGIQADRLVLTGNYETRGEYRITGLSNNGATAFIDATWQGFRRDFSNWWADPPAPNTVNSNAFSQAFQNKRLIRLRNEAGFKFFLAITASSPANANGQPEVSFDNDALPVGGGSTCVGGFLTGATIAPLSMIRYRLVRVVASGAELATKGNNVQLVREELDPMGGADPLDPGQSALLGNNSTRILLDYVVSFDVDFTVDARNRDVTGTAPCLVLYDDGVPVNAATCATANWSPERVRSAIVTLSARTPEQDPRFAWVAPIAGQPLTHYQFSPTRPGSARVRTLRVEVLLSNLAQAGY